MSVYHATIIENVAAIVVLLIVAAWAARREALERKRARCKCCGRPL